MTSLAGALTIHAWAAPAQAGSLLDGTSYRAIRELGAGGMGEVLEAEHRALGHRVVVKVIREELAARPEMLDRMRVEAQALARIRHPNLVMVTDFGHTRSRRPFIVMERLQGRSLREELQARSSLPVAEAAEIGRQMLLGLSAAHAAGLVHRDIKPDNVFLCATEDGRPSVKVLDFGVVKIAQAGRDPRTPEPLLVPTGENIALGTPRYFSPEQARAARDLDARSDLYSVGLVLYAMVVGRGPFDHHRRFADLLHAQLTEAPLSPSTAAAQPIPAALDRILLRALAKPREERFPDALAFAEALSRFLASLGVVGSRSGGAAQMAGDGQDTIEMDEPPGEEPTAAERLNANSGHGVSRGLAAPEGSGEATATASPVAVAAGQGSSGVTPLLRKLPEGPVMIDNLVQRVLGNAAAPGQRPGLPPGQERPSQPEEGGRMETVPLRPVPVPRASRPGEAAGGAVSAGGTTPLVPVPAPRPSSPSPTEPMHAVSAPPAPAPSNPGRASRPSFPETLPLLEVPSARPSPPGGMPPWLAAAPQAAPPRIASSPAPASAAWKVPVAAGASALLVVIGVLLGYLLR